MTSRTILLDPASEARLRELSDRERTDPDRLAARILRRALLAARPRPTFDAAVLRAYTAENAAEEEALADSDLAHRADLLAREDENPQTGTLP